MTAPHRILIFDADPGRGASIAALLEESRPWSGDGSVLAFHELNGADYGPSPAILELQAGLPSLLIIAEPGASSMALAHLTDIAKRQDVATMLLADEVGDLKNFGRRVRNFPNWMALSSIAGELSARVAGILDRVRQESGKRSKLPTLDSRFLAVAIHDLRTPLNVIGLTIRAIIQTVPQRNAALDEDLTFLQDNSLQIKMMLELLSDYCKLMEGESQIAAMEFDPRRFLSDFIDDRRERPGVESTPLRLEIADSCPPEVSLEASRARLALKHALENAINAAGTNPVKLRSSGEGGRWIIELIVEGPPPKILVSMPLRAGTFERLTGSPSERRGLDLSIAARVSELFGGEARLVIEPDRRSTVVLDWPQRMANS